MSALEVIKDELARLKEERAKLETEIDARNNALELLEGRPPVEALLGTPATLRAQSQGSGPRQRSAPEGDRRVARRRP